MKLRRLTSAVSSPPSAEQNPPKQKTGIHPRLHSRGLLRRRITRETNIADLIFKYPNIQEILLDYGLHCAGCIANGFDTVGMGAKAHGMSDSEIDEIVTRVNEVIEHGE